MELPFQHVVNSPRVLPAPNGLFARKVLAAMVSKSAFKDVLLASCGAGMGALSAGVNIPYILAAMLLTAIVIYGVKAHAT